jgi:hypothetical protein
MKPIIALSFLALACAKTGGDSSLPESEPISGPTHTIWAGWNHTWGMLSHRASYIQVESGTGETASSGIVGGDWSTGDTWTDDVEYRIHQQHVTGEVLQVELGSATLIVGPEGTDGTSVDIDMSDAAVVVLQGFEFNTDIDQSEDYPEGYDPALGYTSRGFGMGVSLSEDGRVDVTASVHWGPRDRPDMNSAIPFAQTEVTVHFAALSGFPSADRAHYTGQQDLAHDPPLSAQQGLHEPLEWDGFGFAAIESFELSLFDTDGEDGGDYLRSFGVELAPTEDGRPPTTIQTEILTSAPLELGTMSMAADVTAIWVPLDSSTSRIQGVTLSGSHPVGAHIVPIDLTR